MVSSKTKPLCLSSLIHDLLAKHSYKSIRVFGVVDAGFIPVYVQSILTLDNRSVNLLKLRELLDTDIDPNVKNPAGSTFLATACEWGELSTVRLAMKYPKVDINIKNRKGMTPLMVAANQGNYGIVEELLTRCPEKHHRDICNNRTAEEDARWCGYYGIADMIRDSK